MTLSKKRKLEDLVAGLYAIMTLLWYAVLTTLVMGVIYLLSVGLILSQ